MPFSKPLARCGALLRKEPPDDRYDRQERDRMSAGYTGSFPRNPGQEYGIKNPK